MEDISIASLHSINSSVNSPATTVPAQDKKSNLRGYIVISYSKETQEEELNWTNDSTLASSNLKVHRFLLKNHYKLNSSEKEDVKKYYEQEDIGFSNKEKQQVFKLLSNQGTLDKLPKFLQKIIGNVLVLAAKSGLYNPFFKMENHLILLSNKVVKIKNELNNLNVLDANLHLQERRLRQDPSVNTSKARELKLVIGQRKILSEQINTVTEKKSELNKKLSNFKSVYILENKNDSALVKIGKSYLRSQKYLATTLVSLPKKEVKKEKRILKAKAPETMEELANKEKPLLSDFIALEKEKTKLAYQIISQSLTENKVTTFDPNITKYSKFINSQLMMYLETNDFSNGNFEEKKAEFLDSLKKSATYSEEFTLEEFKNFEEDPNAQLDMKFNTINYRELSTASKNGTWKAGEKKALKYDYLQGGDQDKILKSAGEIFDNADFQTFITNLETQRKKNVKPEQVTLKRWSWTYLKNWIMGR